MVTPGHFLWHTLGTVHHPGNGLTGATLTPTVGRSGRIPQSWPDKHKTAPAPALEVLPLPTVRYGIAAVSGAGDALMAAVASADAALYRAKAQGRNQSVLATTSEP
jgi:hypothetical protein